MNSWVRRAAILALSAAAVAVAGCNIFAAGYTLVHGPPTYPATHQLDKKRPTVIFFDDRANRLPRRALGPMIAEAAERDLLDAGAFDENMLLSSRAATLAANQERFGEPLSIVEIGRAVQSETIKAEVIVWVTVDSFSLSPDGTSYLPSATLRLKVIDLVSGDRIWPEAKTGQAVTFTMPDQLGTRPSDRSEVLKAEEQFAVWLGIGLGQVFHEHETKLSHIR